MARMSGSSSWDLGTVASHATEAKIIEIYSSRFKQASAQIHYIIFIYD